jgi:nucleotide-binding universal stress UspA family protein
MTLLVAVADDELRDAVLETAVELGAALETDLEVVHLTTDATADGDARAIRDQVRERLADAPVGVTVTLEHVEHETARSGTAVGRQIADIASDVAISHVVVGHRSKAVVERLVDGDTAFAVADAVSVPVTVVPPRED